MICFDGKRCSGLILFFFSLSPFFLLTVLRDLTEALQELLTYLDAELREHFVSIDAGELVFCHRWLLLSFKREFEFLDALRLFETLCSHHLEVSSMEAEKARREERRIETARAAGEPASVPGGQADKVHFTYELFVCLAILRHYRAELLSTKDIADVFTFINGYVRVNSLSHLPFELRLLSFYLVATEPCHPLFHFFFSFINLFVLNLFFSLVFFRGFYL